MGVRPESGLSSLSTKNIAIISASDTSKNALILWHCAQLPRRFRDLLGDVRLRNIAPTCVQSPSHPL
jgi:hypothetical protein